ncbi:MAG: polysaccharide biosynthesis C-terminal domain-containing protein, partial [Candidatus Bathyarchaeia archaeon]
ELAVVFRQSVRYATLLVVPMAAAIMVLSPQAVFTLFGSKYVDAPLYLSLLCFGSLYTALGSLSISSFINSRGKTEINMKLGLANTLVGFPLSLVLVSKFQITGLICAGLISTAPSVILGLWLVKKYWGVTIELDASAKVIAASAIAALATYIVISTLILPYWMLLFGGGLLFFIVYAAMTPIVGAVTKGDLKNLQEMFKEFDLLSSTLSKPISLMEKLTRK